MKKFFYTIGISFGILLITQVASAADFKIAPSSGTFGIGKQFRVDIKINTLGGSINAVQGKLKFDPAVVEVTSISKVDSVLNFWLLEPTSSNTEGTLEFIGGTPAGVSGGSLQVLSVTLTAKAIGTSSFEFINAAITISDGSGTNVFGKATAASFDVSSSGGGTAPGKAAAPAPPEPVPSPVQIIRTPAKATGVPVGPEVLIALYPDREHWYNVISNFVAAWNLPADIFTIATQVNANPNYDPTIGEGLFNSKTFPAPRDGVQYLHVRFKNEKGWGPTTHERIAIDTQPPLPFKIDVKTGLKSDDPSPVLAFTTGDATSGMGSYVIQVDKEEPVTIDPLSFSTSSVSAQESEYKLTPHEPGVYVIRVQALDKAGNSVEDRVEVEIVPIETPKITYVTGKVIIGADDRLVVKGTAIPNATVVVSIEDKDKFLIVRSDVATSKNGEWELHFDKELRRGDYFVSVQAKDSRGALSLSTEPIKVKFVEKPVISLFGLDITLKGLVIILVTIGVLAASWFYRKTLLRLARSQRESIIIGRDLKNAFDGVKKDVDRMASTIKNNTSPDEKELETRVISKNIGAALDKIEKYVSKDIERLT